MRTHVIIGGTGFVGGHLVNALVKLGNKVIVIARRPPLNGVSDVIYEESDARLPLCGLSLERIEELKAMHPIVWNLAGNLSFRDEESDEVKTDNMLIATHVTSFANEVGERYVFVSTAYVSGKPQDFLIPEDVISAPIHRNAYESSKWKSEEIVRLNSRVPYVILRPSIIIGDAEPKHAVGCTFGYYRYAYMFFVFKEYLKDIHINSKFHPIVFLFGISEGSSSGRIKTSRLIVPFPSGSRVDMVPVGYIVDLMMEIINHDDAFQAKTTINCTHPHSPFYADLASYLCDDLGIEGARFMPVPHVIFKFGFAILRALIPGRSKEFESASKYLPYITERYNFDHSNSVRYALPEPPKLTRDFLHGVNSHAINEVFTSFNL